MVELKHLMVTFLSISINDAYLWNAGDIYPAQDVVQ